MFDHITKSFTFFDAFGGDFIAIFEHVGNAQSHLVQFTSQHAFGNQFVTLTLKLGIHIVENILALFHLAVQCVFQMRAVRFFGGLAITLYGIISGISQRFKTVLLIEIFVLSLPRLWSGNA